MTTKQAHHIKSRAKRTEVIGCDIQDGLDGTASYEVEALTAAASSSAIPLSSKALTQRTTPRPS